MFFTNQIRINDFLKKNTNRLQKLIELKITINLKEKTL